jgi:FMN reductase
VTEVLVVLGSVTPPGRLHAALAGAVARAGDRADARLIHLADRVIAPADGRPPDELNDDTAAVVAAIAAADVVVFATPVYRGSLTGTLKNLLDQVPVGTLRGTPVGIVAMGATQHHFLGAERHLRDVLAFFGALVAPVAVYLTSADFADGEPRESAREALDELIAVLVALDDAGLGEIAARATPPLAARAG